MKVKTSFIVEQFKNRRFGLLQCIEYAGTNGKFHYISCKCDCGKTCKVVTGNLANGHTKSCGCLREKIGANRSKYKGLCAKLNLTLDEFRNHPVSMAHYGMKNRCNKAWCKDWKYYGGRGIKVCEHWSGTDGLRHFWEDMFPTWKAGLTIERKNNNLGYEPKNCVWVTRKEQQRNKRSNRIYTVNGITACLSEHCEKLQINYDWAYTQLYSGAPPEEVLIMR